MVRTIAGVIGVTVLASAQSVPTLPPTLDGIPGVSGHEGPILFFLGTIVTTLINLYIKKRDREWAIADDDRKRKIDSDERVRLAAEQAEFTRQAAMAAQRTTEVKAAETAAIARHVAESILGQQKLQHKAITDKIDENTEMNSQALSAANAINAKIATIGAAATEMRAGRRTGDAAMRHLHEMEVAIHEAKGTTPPEHKP